MIHSSQRQHTQNDENLLSRCERKKNVGPRSKRGLFRWDATWASPENKSVLGSHASVSCLGGRVVLEYTHSFLKCLPSRVRISFCSSIWVGLGDSLAINRILQKRQGRHCSFLSLSWIFIFSMKSCLTCWRRRDHESCHPIASYPAFARAELQLIMDAWRSPGEIRRNMQLNSGLNPTCRIVS